MFPSRKTTKTEKQFSLKSEVMNYRPVEYCFLRSWTGFLDGLEDRMKRILDKTHPDELNEDMFDSLVDAAAWEVYIDAGRQRVEHLQVIRHHKNILTGEWEEVHRLHQDLESALQEVEEELRVCGDNFAKEE